MTAARSTNTRPLENTDDVATAPPNAINHVFRAAGTGSDFYESAEIACPRCADPQCTVRLSTVYFGRGAKPGAKPHPMFTAWTECGWAFDLRLDTSGGPMQIVLHNLHQRRENTADLDTLVVLDPPPVWKRHLRKAS